MNGAQQNGGFNLDAFNFLNFLKVGKKPKAPFNPADIPSLDVVSVQQLATVQARIDAAIEAGGTPSQADLNQIQQITGFRTSQGRRFVEQLTLFPEQFRSIGIDLGATPQQALADFSDKLSRLLASEVAAATLPPGDLDFIRSVIGLLTLGIGIQTPISIGPGAATSATRFPVATVGTGARGIATRLPAPSQPATPPRPGQTAEQGAVATFLGCLSTAFGSGSTTRSSLQRILSPNFFQTILRVIIPASQPGGATVPFVATPSPSGGGSGFDFGGFLQSGLNLASQFFAPKPQAPTPFFPQTINLPGAQQAGFPLIPFATRLPALAKSILPGFGAGVAGGLVENLFGFGGASTLDESAAFTDPVPGACRPKMHVKTNPCTGKGTWFVPRGRPLVFSGDLSAAKRLDRVARTLDKARPRKRHHHHRTSHRRPR